MTKCNKVGEGGGSEGKQMRCSKPKGHKGDHHYTWVKIAGTDWSK